MALADEITRVIQDRIARFGGVTTEASMVSVGTVISVGDGIARIF
jgi:F0F1-type ATP synthase alpha subunit